MAKSVIKEISIMLLICLAILIVLAIIFYQYIPTNKLVPNKVTAYATPENVKSEIEEETTNYTSESQVYEMTGSDLSIYKQTKSYNPGKPNPFAQYSEATQDENKNTAGQNGTENSNTPTGNTQTNTNSNPDDTDYYYNTAGKNAGTK